MNRKLRKLLRDPARFLLDSRLFGPLRRIQAPAPKRAQATDGAAKAEAPAAAVAVAIDPPRPAQPPNPPGQPIPAATEASAKAEPTSAIPGNEGFALHGQNWLDGTTRPVAVFWGVASCERDVVAQYLPEHRTAFVDARTPWPKLQANLDRLERPRFILRGAAGTAEMRDYASRRGIATERMDDGFICAVSRGEHRSGPCSVVPDQAGLQRLLDHHDFATSTSLLAAVPALMQLHRQLGISQDNPGSLVSAVHLLGPKLMRRVLVVGEEPDPATSGQGTVGAWTARRLVALAVADNPQAEVLFRPAPGELQAWAKDSAARAELGALCRVITEDVALADLLPSVDHVYVVTSLAGMEALIHGRAVTVLGSPFYAGWGLTDDRQPVPRRARRLGLDQLYCAAYLLFPRYLADLDDPVAGCLATMIRVAAVRRQALDAAITAKLVKSKAAALARTDQWPTLLRPENLEQLSAKYPGKLLKVFSIERAFADGKAERFQRAVAGFIAGQLRDIPAATGYLRQVRMAVRPEVCEQVLLDLWRMQPSPDIVEHLAWCREQACDFAEARRLLEHLAFGTTSEKDPACRLPFASEAHPRVLRLAQFELGQKQFERAEQLFNWLLLSGSMQFEVFAGLAAVARLRFDFTSAALLLGIARRLHPTGRLGKAHLQHAQACALAQDAIGTLESLAVACLLNPQFVGSASALQHVLDRHIGALPYVRAMLLATELGESDNAIGRARGLIAHERHADAERLLRDHAPSPANRVRHALALSVAYSYQGKLADAIALVSGLLPTSPTLPVYHEALRLAVAANDYAWGKALLIAARERDLDVKEPFHQKIALNLGEVKESYLGYRKGKGAAMLSSYLGARYVQSLHDLRSDPAATNLVVASSGPGDEIRFAAFYAQIRAAGGDSRMLFTCDPRLHGLLARHYTQLEFVPSARVRFLARLAHFRDHDQLPGSELHALFDNRGWAQAKAADAVILVHDALGDVIEGHASFQGRPCLKADPARVRQWRNRLARERHGAILVGLSWRSSLQSFTRNEHYLAVEDLLPLFELEGVRFVNLQYDDCRDEIAWLEKRCPGRLLHFADLDQFSDLEGVAALMECLDLVIAPCTTVVELAGALGRPTLLLSNSGELSWRKLAGSRMDTWQNAILHVEAPVPGDKQGLVREVASEIRRRVATWRPAVQAIA